MALLGEIAEWSLTSLREKVATIGAKVIAHGRYLVFQMAEVAVPRELFRASSTGSPGRARLSWRDVDPRGTPTPPVAGLTCVRCPSDERRPGARATLAHLRRQATDPNLVARSQK